jgi:glutamate-ammonia-ligase adenylyltransferase
MPVGRGIVRPGGPRTHRCVGRDSVGLQRVRPRDPRGLAALGASGRLDAGTVGTLRDCYRFFRALIDALRVVHGHAQDLMVPPADSEEFVLLARRMRQPDAAALRAEIQDRLGAIRAIDSRLEQFLRRQ